MYRLAIKVFHSDKLRTGSGNEALIQHGSRVFDTLKKAFTKFAEKEAGDAAYAVPDCDL